MPRYIFGLSGPLTGRRFPIGEVPCSFGRSAASTVVLASRQAARHHAELRREACGYMLYDRGSRNGTFVNGEPISAQLLQPGDFISIGDELFGFETPTEPRDPPAAAGPLMRRYEAKQPRA